MPIRIPGNLPAAQILLNENIFVMTEERASSQDIRPLKILVLNLMPTKIATETQLARLLGNTPLQVDLDLIHTQTHESGNISEEHLLEFYQTFDDIKHLNYDGMIITGAPVEQLDFEEVDYWQELCQIFEWSKSHVHSTFHICWGAQAALYYHYGIPKVMLPAKLSGIYKHQVDRRSSMLMRGFDDYFMAPHSRNSGTLRSDIEQIKDLQVVASGTDVGPYAIVSRDGRQVFITGHSEYDWDTLLKEYQRDILAGLKIAPPVNYFLDNIPSEKPVVSWRAHANLLYQNWLNYFVYQTTPYNLLELKSR